MSTSPSGRRKENCRPAICLRVMYMVISLVITPSLTRQPSHMLKPTRRRPACISRMRSFSGGLYGSTGGPCRSIRTCIHIASEAFSGGLHGSTSGSWGSIRTCIHTANEAFNGGLHWSTRVSSSPVRNESERRHRRYQQLLSISLVLTPSPTRQPSQRMS